MTNPDLTCYDCSKKGANYYNRSGQRLNEGAFLSDLPLCPECFSIRFPNDHKAIKKEKEAHPIKAFEQNMNTTPDWWNDLYTDGAGNCFSDADGGL